MLMVVPVWAVGENDGAVFDDIPDYDEYIVEDTDVDSDEECLEEDSSIIPEEDEDYEEATSITPEEEPCAEKGENEDSEDTDAQSAVFIARFHLDDGTITERQATVGQAIPPHLIPIPPTRYGILWNPGQVFMGWFTIAMPIHNVDAPNRTRPFDLTMPITAAMLEWDGRRNVFNLFGSFLYYGDVGGEGRLALSAIPRFQMFFNGLFGFDQIIFETSDVNVDNRISIPDFTMLESFFAGIPVILGVPHPRLQWVRYRSTEHTSGWIPSAQAVVTPGTVIIRDHGNMRREGHRFSHWIEHRGNQQLRWDPGAEPMFNNPGPDFILHAVWIRTMTIVYHGNGHTSGHPPLRQVVDTPYTAIVREPGNMQKEGYTFSHWEDHRPQPVRWDPGMELRFDAGDSGYFHLTAVWISALPAVNCPPLRDVRRGTAAQYLAMGIGWPLGDRTINNVFVPGSSLTNITPFGYFGNRRGGSEIHLGIDITDPAGGGRIMGTPILAVTSGTIAGVTTVNTPNSQGFHISIRSNTHRDPYTNEFLIFTYSHLRYRPTFIVDEPITKGQVIGFVGNSGAETTSPGHLHFEVSNSGGVWTPAGDGVPSRSWHRVTRRVNPIFFYPDGTFTGNTRIWNEVR